MTAVCQTNGFIRPRHQHAMIDTSGCHRGCTETNLLTHSSLHPSNAQFSNLHNFIYLNKHDDDGRNGFEKCHVLLILSHRTDDTMIGSTVFFEDEDKVGGTGAKFGSVCNTISRIIFISSFVLSPSSSFFFCVLFRQRLQPTCCRPRKPTRPAIIANHYIL